MIEYIKKADVIDLLSAPLSRDVAMDYIYELKGVWLDEDEADTPQGEWIETADGTMCSNCHKFPYDDGEYHIANWSSAFCPNCGSYNGGESDE